MWFFYLTTYGYLLMGVRSTLQLFLAVHYLHHSNKMIAGILLGLYKFTWVLYELSSAYAFTITILYWSVGCKSSFCVAFLLICNSIHSFMISYYLICKTLDLTIQGLVVLPLRLAVRTLDHILCESWYSLMDARQFTVQNLDQLLCTGFLGLKSNRHDITYTYALRAKLNPNKLSPIITYQYCQKLRNINC